MNIQRAKQEIEHTVKAYLAKDALGEYAIPAIRQRPLQLRWKRCTPQRHKQQPWRWSQR